MQYEYQKFSTVSTSTEYEYPSPGGHAMGVRHWLDVGDGIELRGHAMGARDWIRAMELICGGAPWGRTTLTRSGRWD